MLKRSFFLLFSSILLFACTPQSTGNQTEKPQPVSTPTPVNISLPETLTILVRDGENGQNLQNITVKLLISSGESKSAETNELGKVIFGDLNTDLPYSIEISSSDYGIRTVSSESAEITRENGSASVTIDLKKGSSTISGIVVDENNQTLSAVKVSTEKSSVFTDEKGAFNLDVGSQVTNVILLNKEGFKDLFLNDLKLAKGENKNLGQLKLSKRNEPLTIVFDTGKTPFGINPDELSTNLSAVAQTLQSSGYKVSFKDIFSFGNLTETDIIFIVSPAKEYSDSEINKLKDFVKSGKKLIISGEWGGFSGFSKKSVNKLLLEANLRINEDIVKEEDETNFQQSADQIVSTSVVSHFITKGLTKGVFYGSSSLEVINGGVNQLDTGLTKLLVLSTANSFRIKLFDQGQFGLAGISSLGFGKIVVFADSSFMTISDSNNDGIINLDEANNKSLIINAVNW